MRTVSGYRSWACVDCLKLLAGYLCQGVSLEPAPPAKIIAFIESPPGLLDRVSRNLRSYATRFVLYVVSQSVLLMSQKVQRYPKYTETTELSVGIELATSLAHINQGV